MGDTQAEEVTAMKQRKAILNPDKDMSAAHAFDGERLLPRAIIDPNCEVIPYGEHEDDDRFLIVEVDEDE